MGYHFVPGTSGFAFMKRFPVIRIPLILLALAWLASCTTTGYEPVTDSTAISAEQAFNSGRYAQAARAWQQQASSAEADLAPGLWLNAADAWMLASEPDRARTALKWVDRSSLDSEDSFRLDLVLADLALSEERPMEAWQLLEKARPGLGSASRDRYEGLAERTNRMLESPLSQDMARAAELSATMRYYDPTGALGMLQALEPVSSGELAIRAANPRGDRRLIGWMDLALVVRENLVRPEQVTRAISDWKKRNPAHLLNEKQALDTWLVYRQQFRPPARVAALLPGEGRFAAAGLAVRDGLLSAFADQPAGAELLLFETTDDPQSAIAAYFSALDASADLIIGPMTKESVEAMLTLAGMSTPVLALNEFPPDFASPMGLEGQLAGISLSQERTVESMAVTAIARAHRRAVVLAPESAWGERMVQAFEEAFLQREGEIVVSARYPETENDHSALLERILEIDQSEARKRRLENTLQQRLEFQPVRRTDVDMIFLAATPQQARLIRPQLRFLDAGDVPVYSPERVYGGAPDPAGNQDLNGIRFPITPWQLEHPNREDIPGLQSIRGGSLGALYALGRDAWNMLPWLPLMRQDPDFRFPGDSGYYRSMQDENLVREPAWAVFEQGMPSPLPPATPSGN
jgi:outer membrane PBP1 activator LpoA protein